MIRSKRTAEEVGLLGLVAVATAAVLATSMPTPGGLLLAALTCASGVALIAGAAAWLVRPHVSPSARQRSERMPDELNAF